MTYAEICEPSTTPERSSRSADAGRSKRTPGQETEFAGEFIPAICTRPGDVQSVRLPEWYVLRIVAGGKRTLFRVLDYVGLSYHDFTFEHRQPRKRPTIRSWFPGILFIEFDYLQDNWAQVNRMPYSLGILGGPTPLNASGAGSIDDLRARLPYKLPKATASSVYAPGTLVRIRSGSFEDHVGTVMRSERKRVWVNLMVFGRPTEIEIDVANVEAVKS